MEPETRLAVVLGSLGFVRSAALGGTVVVFLALAGAISGRAASLLAVGVVVAAALQLLGMIRFGRRASTRAAHDTSAHDTSAPGTTGERRA